jgi:hypothetical protein
VLENIELERLSSPEAWLDDTCVIAISDMLLRDNLVRVLGQPLHPKAYVFSPRFLNKLLSW